MPNRRSTLQGVLATTVAGGFGPLGAWAQTNSPYVKPIPSTGEQIPMVGLGSWIRTILAAFSNNSAAWSRDVASLYRLE